MPTPVAPVSPEAVNLALLLDTAPNGRYAIRAAMSWSLDDLNNVLSGVAHMSSDEIEKVVSFFGVTPELLSAHQPMWSCAPGFNLLMSNFLRRIKIGTYGAVVSLNGQRYRVGGGWPRPDEVSLDRLLDQYEHNNIDVPQYVIGAIARAAGVPLDAMNYLSRKILSDLVSVATARHHHKELVRTVVRSVGRANDNADRIAVKLERIPQALRPDCVQVPRVRVIEDAQTA